MKRILFLFLAIVFIFACKPSTLEKVRNEWGPPAKVVETETAITWFYYFNRSLGRLFRGGGATGIVVYEITADKSGRIDDVKKYWKQPELKPEVTEMKNDESPLDVPEPTSVK